LVFVEKFFLSDLGKMLFTGVSFSTATFILLHYFLSILYIRVLFGGNRRARLLE
jgi:hypothetical protein